MIVKKRGGGFLHLKRIKHFLLKNKIKLFKSNICINCCGYAYIKKIDIKNINSDLSPFNENSEHQNNDPIDPRVNFLKTKKGFIQKIRIKQDISQ